MHHSSCVTHVPWCTVGIANPQWRGKRSQHPRRLRNPQFYVSGKRPMEKTSLLLSVTREYRTASNKIPYLRWTTLENRITYRNPAYWKTFWSLTQTPPNHIFHNHTQDSPSPILWGGLMTIIMPSAPQSCWGVYRFHSVRLSVRPFSRNTTPVASFRYSW